MRIHETEIFKFEELSEAAKAEALVTMFNLNVDHEWWEATYEDAARVGIAISGFEYGGGNSIDAELECERCTAKLIVAEHGPTTETFKLASAFLALPMIDGEKGLSWDDGFPGTEAAREFRRAIFAEYLEMLRSEYEYLTSDEAVREAIIANDYEFTAAGHFWTQ